MALSVQLIDDSSALTEEMLGCWNRLSRSPLMRWEWLGSWWDAYGHGKSLHVLVVRDDDEIVGFAPWFLDHHVAHGRQIRFLGSGKACTDHLSILVSDENADVVAKAIARWLVEHPHVWDQLELVGVDRPDHAIDSLCDALRSHRLAPEVVDGVGCYAIDLPSHWEGYVQMRSKSGRRETRQSYNNIEDGTLQIHCVQTLSQLDERWSQFVRLHQARRATSDSPGCFDEPSFESFLRTAAERLLDVNMLELVIATIEDVPVAAHFALVDKDDWYFYQSGMNSDHSGLRPGLSVFCFAVSEAISRGQSRLDMMRGDEPYKQRWHATLRPTQEVRVFSLKASSQLRRQILNVGKSLVGIVKSGLVTSQGQSL